MFDRSDIADAAISGVLSLLSILYLKEDINELEIRTITDVMKSHIPKDAHHEFEIRLQRIMKSR